MSYWDTNREDGYLDGEAEAIERARGRKPATGVALSGGGIRSATFSLGVLQALAKSGFLEKIDYLSTVSGGGYIGSSLHWWWNGRNGSKTPFGPGKDDFPYGCDDPEDARRTAAKQGKILCYLRSHGNYLVPGGGIGFFSGIGIVLRGVALNLILWLTLATAAAWGLICLSDLIASTTGSTASAGEPVAAIPSPLGQLAEVVSEPSGTVMASYSKGTGGYIQLPFVFALCIWVAYFIAAWFVVAAIFYSFATFFGRSRGKPTADDASEGLTFFGLLLAYLPGGNRYAGRRVSEQTYQKTLPLCLVFLAIGLIPVLHGQAAQMAGKPGLQGLIATGIGVVSGLWGYVRSARQLPSGPVSQMAEQIALPVGSALFLYGAAILSYDLAIFFREPEHYFGETTSLDPLPFGLTAGYLLLVLTIAAVVMAFAVNINHISPHRFYRDRLMEAFMPAWTVVERNISGWSPDADRFRMSEAWPSDTGAAQTPFPIVNANAVLVNESTKKQLSGEENNERRQLKLRGGDNFVLTPYACGCRATGWRTTTDFMADGMTLASAMAISGAAANPDSGYLGTGQTRNRTVSLVMRLFNLRLGYWVPNPRRKWQVKLLEMLRIKPNHIWPGFSYAVTPMGHRSSRWLLELTDGGHFDNLAVYELVRRRASLILVCDGEADEKTAYNALVSLIRRVEQDFEAKITFEPKVGPELLVENCDMDYPSGAKCAKQGYFVAKIEYPPHNGKPKAIGAIIYIKATMIDGVSLKTKGYKGAHPKFPDQPTADQFFDEEQFEAYRELGYKIAQSATSQLKLSGCDCIIEPNDLIRKAWAANPENAKA